MMTPNRLAAVAIFLTSLGTDVTTLAGALPRGAATVAGVVAGTLGAVAAGIHYMTGAQKSEALAHERAIVGSDADKLRAQIQNAGMEPVA